MGVVSAATVIAVVWTLQGICLTLILARLYLRLRLQHQKLILSDYFICLAWLSAICQAAVEIEFKKLGLLNSSSTWAKYGSTTGNPYVTQAMVFVSWFPLFTTQYLNKAALLSFFFYIFPSNLRSLLYSLWIATVYCGVAYIATILLVFLICLPVETKGFSFLYCGIRRQFVIWNITWALHFSSDIIIFILPLSIMRILRLNWKKKLGLYVTFGFGVFSISACVARFVIILSTYPNVPVPVIEFWCAIDSYTGLIVACLPSLRPYLNLEREPPP
jgi:hypothetical protein